MYFSSGNVVFVNMAMCIGSVILLSIVVYVVKIDKHLFTLIEWKEFDQDV